MVVRDVNVPLPTFVQRLEWIEKKMPRVICMGMHVYINNTVLLVETIIRWLLVIVNNLFEVVTDS